VTDIMKQNRKTCVMLLILICMLIPLFCNPDIQQPVYFIDNDIRSFTNVIQQGSLIYALGGDRQNLYFYCFDQELHLILKKRVSDVDYNTLMIPFKRGFLIKNTHNKKSRLLYIDKTGNIINSLAVDGKIEDCFVDNKGFLLLIRRNRQLLIAEVNKKFEYHSEMVLPGISESSNGRKNRIQRTRKYNYVILCSDAASIYVYDRSWNFLKKMILADNSNRIDYQLEIHNDQVILDPLRGTWLFYPEYYVDFEGNLPEDQVLFYDFKGNLIEATDIPRQKKCTSEMIYGENLFVQQSEYLDDLIVVSTDGNIRQKVDFDFSFHIKDHQILSSDKILFAGAYCQCRRWHRRGLLMICESPQESLTLFPMNEEAHTLEAAFETGNTEMLSELMGKWYQADIQPKTEFDHNWEKEAYALYQMIIPKVYQSSRSGTIYESGKPYWDHEYHLLPNHVYIEIADSIFTKKFSNHDGYYWTYQPTEIKHEIRDFRPEIPLDIKVMYSTDEISVALLSFFSISPRDGLDSQRRQFLKNYISIPYRDGGIAGAEPAIYGFYDYSRIVFDKHYQKAIITSNFRGRYNCVKESGVWEYRK
jgi:hypothetical protein